MKTYPVQPLDLMQCINTKYHDPFIHEWFELEGGLNAEKAACPIVVTVIQNSELIKKNAPFKRTTITLKVLDVLSADFVKEHNTAQLSEVTGELMLKALTPQTIG